jgi:hypothetical protein
MIDDLEVCFWGSDEQESSHVELRVFCDLVR